MTIDKSYNPSSIEQKWYKLWEEKGLFAVEVNPKRKNFCIQLPPPNVTGNLHMGHAFQQTLMDILIRYHRMKGYNANWIVGTDHAGIATQIVVERQLELMGQDRESLGRKNFLNKVWEWKQKSGSRITEQMRRIGASANWNYASNDNAHSGYFTMDEKMSSAVRKVFVELYKNGLIYRGKRLVNWDPELQTAVSDLEVESEEESGMIWEIKYRLKGSQKNLVIATTRPETLLGDTAIAVSPSDERYKNLIGSEVIVPIVNRSVKVIADDYVDPEFGTGCVKITPGHDFNDYEIGLRHNLDMINILSLDGKLNKNCPEKYRDLSREDGRKKILEHLAHEGALVSEKPHQLKIPRSGRTGTVIEPMLTDQWFLKMEQLADSARKVVKEDKVEFVPRNWENTYFHWLDNIKDWCISRQLWWGHQIPAWHTADGKIYVAESSEEAFKMAKKDGYTGVLTRDPDVLDTWFSSALVPFTSLGWPAEDNDTDLYLPSDVLITGFDIIFFWVARMVMMTLKFTNKVPFRKIYINALVRDADGQKMSKSKGNTIDPIDLIDGISHKELLEKSMSNLMKQEHKNKVQNYIDKNHGDGIKAYGADALRFTFCSLATFSRTLNFDLNRCDGYRNFCNKLWNATRFVLMQCKKEDIDQVGHLEKFYSFADHWIISQLHLTIGKTEKEYDKYRFDLLSNEIYRFVWDEFCDWYLEIAKTQLKSQSSQKRRATQEVLIKVLDATLRMSHPIIPFITEELWQKISELTGLKGESIVVSKYPQYDEKYINHQARINVEKLKTLVIGCRKLRKVMAAKPNEKVTIYFESDKKILDEWRETLKELCGLEDIKDINDYKNTLNNNRLISVVESDFKLSSEKQINIEEERAKLLKEADSLSSNIRRITSKLENQNFINKAPSPIVNKEKDLLRQQKNTLKKIQIEIERLI